MKEPTMKDWLALIAASFVVGGVIGGLTGGVTTWLYWILDIPAVIFLCWWFMWRTPKPKAKKDIVWPEDG